MTSQDVIERIALGGVSVGVSADTCGGIGKGTGSVGMKLTGIKVSEAMA